jgi:2-polyprenyl-6-methoxyphenol hydroxylase-like FAD-dependent oxidoreductase
MDVILVGAGIGGLTLAALLAREQTDVQVTVLERDGGIATRPQGYGVGLRGAEGLAVLERLGLDAEVGRLARPIESFTLMTSSGRVLRRAAPSRGGSGERLVTVPRVDLRRLLVEACTDGCVRFGAHVTELAAGGRPRVTLADGERLTADLVVAADGSRSLARRLLVGRELRYIGLTRIGAVAQRVVHPLLDEGTVMTLGDGCSTFLQPLDDRRLAWSFTTRAPEGSFGRSTPEELIAIVRETTHAWPAPLPAVLAATDMTHVTARGLFDLPSPHRARHEGVAFVGDAAHAMTPYRGVGANMAMVDAAELVDALRVERTVEPALAAYEVAMLPRNRAAVERSHDAAVSLHPRGRLGVLRRNSGLRATGAFARLRGG